MRRYKRYSYWVAFPVAVLLTLGLCLVGWEFEQASNTATLITILVCVTK